MEALNLNGVCMTNIDERVNVLHSGSSSVNHYDFEVQIVCYVICHTSVG